MADEVHAGRNGFRTLREAEGLIQLTRWMRAKPKNVIWLKDLEQKILADPSRAAMRVCSAEGKIALFVNRVAGKWVAV